MDNFQEHKFKARVDAALSRVRTILENHRLPQYPADVHHQYEDKYLLAEFLTNTAIAAHLNSLESLGVSLKPLAQLQEWASTRSVTLRLTAEEQCKFVKEVTREVESDTKSVTKGLLGKTERYTVTKVTEYIWAFTAKWELSAFVGVEHDKRIVLQSRTGTVEVKTSVKDVNPKTDSRVYPSIDVNLTWLLQHADENRTPKFSIDRKSKLCRTPRRNPEVDAALKFMREFYTWVDQVTSYFYNTLFPTQANHGLDLSSLSESAIFVPVLPLLEANAHSSSSSSALTTTGKEADTSVLPPVFLSSFLGEQARSLDAKLKELEKVFSANEKLITIAETKLYVSLLHTKRVSEAYSEGVDYIESLLRKQLIAAIGKEVTPVDFTHYLTFHNRKVFREGFRPQAFCYAIRRPDHYPEGTLSIEAKLDDGALSDPIPTIVASSTASRPINFNINAATSISVFGERHLHGYVSHQFEGYSGTNLSLYARARQFSSFILLVGRIVSADQFDPKYGIIIQNKDELEIPLLLETIPTPKEFKDAIQSLSPEQQRFCKAFRSMQLESTLFGVCVIQIKPQLEKLLKLPEDSLTKEIQLTQDLLGMFIKYQIPSDLVSYDGAEAEAVPSKIARVKEYVSRMQLMLDASKKAELEEAQKEQQMRLAQPRHDYAMSQPVPPPPSFASPSRSSNMVYPSASMPRSSLAAPGGGGPPVVHSSREGASGGRGGMSGGPPRPSAAPVPAPPPAAQPNAPEPPKAELKPQDKQWKDASDLSVASSAGAAVDYTKIPIELERKFDELDENNALRPTIINTASTWKKSFQKTLLSEPEKKTVDVEEQGKERNKAFDLLDALTKSGALSIDYASLHVVIASTHCFAKNIIQTVVQDNVNPIEKVENSSFIVASTIHATSPAQLIAPEHLERISTTSPLLMGHASNNNNTKAISYTQ